MPVSEVFAVIAIVSFVFLPAFGMPDVGCISIVLFNAIAAYITH
jgi:hypothetical protein